ncbi:uncharacterized protein [Ptychodera flava]|uniref:uncharacterized protein n=1 Tax=Ptychodera flava TaxID=63121 RepID=UPI00396A6EAE
MKTLGVWWLAGEDVFTFKVNPPAENYTITKRSFLSRISTLFDPIGFLSPFTIRAKVLLQEIWAAGLEWDDDLDIDLMIKAQRWFAELIDLGKIRVPRCLQLPQEVVSVNLHTFVDASQDAYGAVTYARSTYATNLVSCRMVAAKSRVAPLTSTSISRLELMGAIVGLRLKETISEVLGIMLNQVVFWSDSMNVLWWIRNQSRKFKPFVANRVGEIQTSTNPEQWRYVPTKENPADLVTIGVTAVD